MVYPHDDGNNNSMMDSFGDGYSQEFLDSVQKDAEEQPVEGFDEPVPPPDMDIEMDEDESSYIVPPSTPPRPSLPQPQRQRAAAAPSAYVWHDGPAHEEEQEEEEEEEKEEEEEEEAKEDAAGGIMPSVFAHKNIPLPKSVQRYYFTNDAIKRQTADLVHDFEMPPGEGATLVAMLGQQIDALRLDVDDLAIAIRKIYNLCGGDSRPENALDVHALCNRIYPAAFEQSETGIIYNTKVLYFYTGSLLATLKEYDRAHNPQLAKYDVAELYLHLTRSFERLYAMEMYRVGLARLRSTFHPQFDALMSYNDGLVFNAFINEVEFDDFQKAMIHMLRKTFGYRARRFHSYIYLPRIINGVFTHSFEPKFTIGEFIQSELGSINTGSAFRLLVRPRMPAHLEEHLSIWNSPELPILLQDRHSFSFRNGIYNAMDDRFYLYGKAPRKLISVNYIDAEFDPYLQFNGPYFPRDVYAETDAKLQEAEDDWMNIPTPHFDRLFLHQWPEGVDEQQRLASNERTLDPKLLRRMTYAFLGRLLFSVKERDRFQRIPIILGRGGTGKSIIAVLFHSYIYKGKIDVATIGAESQETFGLETVYDKLLFVITEMRRNRQGGFGLPETDFLAMVAGDPVGIRRKHKEMLEVVWTVPGLIVGNSFCGYKEDKGSLSRRLFLVNFDRVVPKRMKDEGLEDRIVAERPAIILKLSRAYNALVNYIRDSGKNLDVLIPRQVERNIYMLMSSADEVLAFIRSTDNKLVIEVDQSAERRANPVLWMPWDELYRLFLEWKRAHGIKGNSDRVYQPHEWIDTLHIFGCSLYPSAGGQDQGDNQPSIPKASRNYPRQTQSTRSCVWVMNVDSVFCCSAEEKELYDAVVEEQPAAAEESEQPQAQVHPHGHRGRGGGRLNQNEQRRAAPVQPAAPIVRAAPLSSPNEEPAVGDAVADTVEAVETEFERIRRAVCALGRFASANGLPGVEANNIRGLGRRIMRLLEQRGNGGGGEVQQDDTIARLQAVLQQLRLQFGGSMR